MVSLRPGWVTEWHLASEAETGAEELAQQLKVLGKLRTRVLFPIPMSGILQGPIDTALASANTDTLNEIFFFCFVLKEPPQITMQRQANEIPVFTCLPAWGLVVEHTSDISQRRNILLTFNRECPLWLAIAYHQTQQAPSHREEIEYKEITRLWMGG